jgi:HlyD family secretion protein
VATTLTKRLVPIALLALVILVVALRFGRGDQPQHFTAKVERGAIDDVVEATGTVNAVVTVQVGSQVSGTIAKLNADFNTKVKTGDVLAIIDPSLFQGALLQATADWESAKASRKAALANLEKAKATLEQTTADYERSASLAKQGMATQQEAGLAKAAHDVASASVGVADADVAQADALVSQKAAAEAVARTNLDHTVIRSPIEGIVVARNVDVGQTVAASLQAPTLFTIAQDLTKMRVYAKTDESDVGSIKVGETVSFRVDAFPKETFQGALAQIRMNPTTIQNVVTYDAVIDFQNPQMRLFPGMTAYVTIPVASVRQVLKVPNAALRYKPPFPPEQVRGLYQQYGIVPGAEPRAGPDSGRGPGAASPARSIRAESAVVWKLRVDRSLEPVKIALGITDHAFTEVTAVLKGDLAEGTELVTRSIVPNPQAPGGQRLPR